MYPGSGRRNSPLTPWFTIITTVLVLGVIAIMEANAKILKAQVISEYGNGGNGTPEETDNHNPRVQNERKKRCAGDWWIQDTEYSAYGQKCKSDCNTQGVYFKAYLRCTTDTTSSWSWAWDYCSKYRGLDYKSRVCTNECGYHGKSYQWCYVEGGGWGYCSY